jgi:hypothetical protein
VLPELKKWKTAALNEPVDLPIRAGARAA